MGGRGLEGERNRAKSIPISDLVGSHRDVKRTSWTHSTSAVNCMLCTRNKVSETCWFKPNEICATKTFIAQSLHSALTFSFFLSSFKKKKSTRRLSFLKGKLNINFMHTQLSGRRTATMPIGSDSDSLFSRLCFFSKRLARWHNTKSVRAIEFRFSMSDYKRRLKAS